MRLYIYGAGGHGKVAFYTLLDSGSQPSAFIDDHAQGSVCNLPILALSAILLPCAMHFAIGNNAVRHNLQSKWHDVGVELKTAISSKAYIYPGAHIGLGSLIVTGSIIGPDVQLGEGCIVNHNAVIDHDCVVGNFCHIAPGATLAGGVIVGLKCLIGAGARILPGLKIGHNVTVGAGAVVISDLPDGVTAVGCPARFVFK